MADNGKFEEAGSDGIGGQETSATHHQSPQMSPGQKDSI